HAQVSITGAIAGTVMDASDAVLPGAMVLLKDEGTGIEKTTITNEAGGFAFRDLKLGSYQVTVTLTGFQSALYSKVVVEAGRTTDLRIKLGIGAVEQSVTVEGTTPVLERSSNVISATLTNKDVNELPLAGRNAFTLARLIPGAVAPQGTGSTHYNGMPGGTINPTIDGVNNASNGFKSGGTSFFGTVPARLGAVEQVTVETGGLGGDDGVTGGVNLKFVTRRGTNRYSGSFFEQYRTDKLNANTFGNAARGLPKDELRRHDFGGNFGGPITRTGPLANKLFGFANFEVEWIPQTQTRSQTTLTEEARLGIFRYVTAGGEQRTVNVLSMAGAAGLQSAPDPIMAALLAQQAGAKQNATLEPGTTLRQEVLSWREPQKQINYYPTVRFDYQIKQNLSFMSSYSRYNQDAQGRRVWPIPGFPINADTFDSGWWVWATGTNWTINQSMHNEVRFGIQHSGDTNEVGRQREFFELNGIVNGLPARFQFPNATQNNPFISLLVNDAAPVIGKHYITTITDTLTVIRGNHTFKLGGNFRDTQWRDRSLDGAGTGGYLGLPRYAIGVATGDPITSVLSTSTIPGLQAADATQAQLLYALLTGRLSEVRTGGVVDPATLQYSSSVFRENWTSAWFAGLFVQDAWRVTPQFTLNYGLRYEMNQPPFNHTGTVAFPDDANIFGPSTALFQPGTLNGVQDPVFRRAKVAAGTDWLNLAPRVGFAWTPLFGDGWLGKVFGRGDETVFRGGWDITYFDEGTNMFASTAGNNTGQSQVLLLQPGMPGFTPGGLTLQSPLPPFQASPAAYQDVWAQSEIAFVNGLGSMFSDLETGYVQSWNIGLQREIAKNTVVEIRYLGNRAEKLWHAFSLNEVNIFENGYLDEFRRAQQNLAINE
ncbi:MAG TPA: carboxypeptidase-like regulatory domain-containing protein, partial [Vicinamibacterales bacterium]